MSNQFEFQNGDLIKMDGTVIRDGIPLPPEPPPTRIIRELAPWRDNDGRLHPSVKWIALGTVIGWAVLVFVLW